jgi:hypothetical protein
MSSWRAKGQTNSVKCDYEAVRKKTGVKLHAVSNCGGRGKEKKNKKKTYELLLMCTQHVSNRAFLLTSHKDLYVSGDKASHTHDPNNTLRRVITIRYYSWDTAPLPIRQEAGLAFKTGYNPISYHPKLYTPK